MRNSSEKQFVAKPRPSTAFLLLLGMQIYQEALTLMQQIPTGMEAIAGNLGIEDPHNQLLDMLEQSGALWTVFGYTFNLVNILTSIIAVLVAGVFLAWVPTLIVPAF